MRILILSSLLLCFNYLAFSQGSKLSIGPRLGLNMGDLTIPTENEAYGEFFHRGIYHPGVNIGLVANYRFSRLFRFQPELLFSTKGFQILLPDETKLSAFHYVEVPLLLNFDMDGAAMWGGANFGPYFGYALAGKFKDPLEVSPIDKLDYGLMFGAELLLDVGKGTLIFEFRYTLGLAELGGSLDEDLFGGIHNRVIGLLFTYLWQTSKE